jgi:hypothetical protein
MKSPIALFCIKVASYLCIVFIGLFICAFIEVVCERALAFSINIGPFNPLLWLWSFAVVFGYSEYEERFDAFFAKKS